MKKRSSIFIIIALLIIDDLSSFSQNELVDSIGEIRLEESYCFDLAFKFKDCELFENDSSFTRLLLNLEKNLEHIEEIYFYMSCYQIKESSFILAECRLEYLKSHVVPESLRKSIVIRSSLESDISKIEAPARLNVLVVYKRL